MGLLEQQEAIHREQKALREAAFQSMGPPQSGLVQTPENPGLMGGQRYQSSDLPSGITQTDIQRMLNYDRRGKQQMTAPPDNSGYIPRQQPTLSGKTLQPLSDYARLEPDGSAPAPIVDGRDELEQMRKDEDFRGKSYLDKTNTDSQTGRKRALTIGYGFNMDQAGAEKTMRKAGITKNWGDLRSGKSTLTKAEGLALQNVSYAGYAKSAMNFAGGQSWNIMSGDQRNALINLVSNMGSGKLNKRFPSMRREMRAGNFARAAHELMVDKGGVNPSAYALQVGDRATRIASRLSGQTVNEEDFQYGVEPTPQQELQLGKPSGWMTPEGRRAYHNNRGGMSTEYSIGVMNPSINNGLMTHIPSIYDGKIVGQQTAEQMVIDNNGYDVETGRFITAGGDPEARSRGIQLIKQHARKPSRNLGIPQGKK